MGNKIKIYVIGHKYFDIPKSNILIPIMAGAINKKQMSWQGLLRDNVDENISSKNPQYSELTAQYYVMKNEDADYYGFFHYRRYLNFSDKTSKRPYVYFSKDIGKLGEFININGAEEVIEQYDILLPRPENFFMTVYEHYNTSPSHVDKSALQNILKITRELYPEYVEDVDEYVNGYDNYLGNMYIMKKDLANQYFNFLVNIFTKFDALYEDVPLRTQGFLAERLFGVFFNHIKRTTDLKYKFLQRVDVLKYYDKKHLRRLGYLLFPPSSKIRSQVKLIRNNKCK